VTRPSHIQPACHRTAAIIFRLLLTAFAFSWDSAAADGSNPAQAADYFAEEVWPKVAAQSCLECHRTGGDAEESKFILQDPARDTDQTRHTSLEHNRAAFLRMAAPRRGDQSRLLLKATGGLAHGGEEVLKPDSAGYRILAEFVRRATNSGAAPAPSPTASAKRDAARFFDGIAMLDDRRLLRRAGLSLAGRLPSAEESAQVSQGSAGGDALRGVLDQLMKEEAFYERLAEGFNDIFLTRGYGEEPESALPYEQFEKTRHWTQKFDLSHVGDEKAQQKARYKLADDYREALRREPLELIKYIVRNDRPFTEIVTADYVMLSPFTARGYGNFEEIRDRFHNPDDPFEYIPVRLHALKSRNEKNNQQTPTGFYPHAGLLSTFQYLRRYPTTETNRNRLRGRMFFQHFLGIDVLELAARVTDAAAVTAKYEIPTMQAAECVVCHKGLDPVAGLFQDFYSFDGVYGPRKEGWFKDMFGPGFDGEELPEAERWRALAWLGERTARDPRFATTMVEHVYYLLTGRRPLLRPKGIDDPLFPAKLRAYQAQRDDVERIAAAFVKANFNLKEAFKLWIASPFYRADALAWTVNDPARRAELADVGVARILSPEQLERKIIAIFGKPWGRLKDEQFALLYGGIDSKEVTERAADPSGAMGAIQRIMANEVACKNVAADFALEPGARRLFPNIEPDARPGESAEIDERIRAAIIHLHELIPGRNDQPESAAVRRTFALFTNILHDAQEHPDIEPLENYSCRATGEERVKDKDYTIRAWRAVVTYLLRQREFLYE
jgi:hypothetical protein